MAYASQFVIVRAYLWCRTSHSLESLLIRIGVVVIDELGLLLTRYLAVSVDPLYLSDSSSMLRAIFAPLRIINDKAEPHLSRH